MYEEFGGQTHRNRLSFLKVTPSDVRGCVKVGSHEKKKSLWLGSTSK
jgi:hypothetical protein